MGDRRNIELVYNSKDEYGQTRRVYLYTHWRGSELPTIVANTLNSKQGRNRWNDPSYLARIIFTNMMKNGINDDGETGFGISPNQGDYNHANIIIDLDEQTVDGFSFDEYIAHFATDKETASI